MDNFISKEVEKIYLTFKNNERLQKALDDNYLILKRQSLIGEYTESAFNQKVEEIELINKDKLYSLSSLCYDNKDTISNTELSILIDNSFLKKDIKDIYEGVEITNETLSEIFFCFKYCTVSSFFQNNRKYFMPDYDLKKIEENEKLDVFTDAILKEFDKLNTTLSGMKDIIDIDNIDSKYLSYLSQLLGYEKRDIPSLNEESFRELVKNIIEIYKIKGTNYSFELFFNFLGFNIEIQEFFFDRRYLYKSGGNNDFTNEKSTVSYNHYLTTINPTLNKNDIFTRTEVVNYSDIGAQHSLLEFDDLAKKYGAEAVLGYSKLDKYNKLYTGKVYTYFRTNYIYYNVTLPDRFPTSKELVAITSYLNFLSPVFIMRTIETQSSEEERDTMSVDMLDWQTTVDGNGNPINQVREYVIYNYTNSQLGQNYGKNLVFTRMFNCSKTVDGVKTGYLEVNPYPADPYNVQNDWYVNNTNCSDITATKAFVAAHPEKFGKKIDETSSGTASSYLLGDQGFVQDFDNSSATDIKALVVNKTINYSFNKIYSQNHSNTLLDISSPSYIFNTKEELDSALLTQSFRSKLFYGMKIAITETANSYGIYRYQIDKASLSGSFSNPVAHAAGMYSDISFETIVEAREYANNNAIPFGCKVYINDKKLVYTYNITNSKNVFETTKGYLFETLSAARTYFNSHASEILLNVEFYVKSEYRTYRFEHKNRFVNKTVWFSGENKLYKFIDGTNDESFTEISLEGIVSSVNGVSYVVDDPAYPSYNEKEDKENFLFYNNSHDKIRPNKYKSFTAFETDNIPFLIKYYASTYYSSISYREAGILEKLIDDHSAYQIYRLPEVLTYIYTGNYQNDDTLLGLIITSLTNMRDAVKAYNSSGNVIQNTPSDMLVNYNKLINFVGMFIGYDSSLLSDKDPFITMFSDKEYVEKVIAWREKFFNDDSLNGAIIEPDKDIILGNAKASLGKKLGKLYSPIGSFVSDSFSAYDTVKCSYYKPKIPFYGMSNVNGGKISFYVLESDLSKYCDVNILLQGTTATFLNAVYYSNFQKNYPSYVINDFMKIPFEISSSSIYRGLVSGRKFIIIQTSMPASGDFLLLSSKIEGHLFFNNFKKIMRNNRLVYPRGLSFINKDSLGNPTGYSSWGYDKEFTTELQNKSFTPQVSTVTKDTEGNIVISSTTNDYLKSSNENDYIELEYLPQSMEIAFDCSNSEDNNDDIVFELLAGSSADYEQGDVLIDCGGSE